MLAESTSHLARIQYKGEFILQAEFDAPNKASQIEFLSAGAGLKSYDQFGSKENLGIIKQAIDGFKSACKKRVGGDSDIVFHNK